MRWPGDRLVWTALVALAVLLGGIGALQYRWIGEIGQAEADRLAARASGGATRVAAELDRELRRLLDAFAADPTSAPADRREDILQRLTAWRGDAEHPALLESVSLATRAGDGGGPRLESVPASGGDLRASPWPAELGSVRSMLDRGHPEWERRRGRPRPLTGDPFLLTLPLLRRGQSERRPFTMDGVLVLHLSRHGLAQTVLPALATSVLGPLGDGDLTVAVFRAADRSVVWSSEPELPAAELWGLSPTKTPLLAPRFGRGQARRAPAAASDDPAAPWLLVAGYRGGALPDVVAAARRRNLAASAGGLALLGVVAALLVVVAGRSQRLARQRLEFVAGVTHELNTPIAAIRSAGQNLADGIVSDPERIRRYGRTIETEADRLGGLVAQVLEFAGIESGAAAPSPQPVEVSAVVEAALTDMQMVLEQSGLRLEQELSPALPLVLADAGRLRRAVANLVVNATRHAADGGFVRVTTAVRGGCVEVRVEDGGPGIPRDERQRVFEPFVRGRAALAAQRPGSGLGLSLVRHVAASAGGSVRIDDRSGGGAAITLSLPAQAAT